MKKRFLTVCLVLALCAGLAVPAFAADKTTYYLNFSQFTSAENSEVSITGEDLKQTGEIYCEYGLGAGQDIAPRDYYPVFAASKPVTVTVTADYTDWRHTGTDRESGDDFDYIGSATVSGLSYDAAKNEYTEINEHAAYFEGTYATRLDNGSIKENAGTLKEYYIAGGQEWIYIYKGATVTLSEPGAYKVSVMSHNLWSTRCNYAIINIIADGSQPVDPPAPATPSFTDLPNWCAKEAQWAAAQGIAQGTGGSKFSPGSSCTHEQILTFLYRAVRGEGPAASEDMALAVAWAREEGIIDDSFNPKAPCPRADAVTYIWRAMGSHKAAAGSSFTDISADADCAAAVAWAVEKEITNGFANGDGTFRFRPDQVCRRGEIACFLYRAYRAG